MKIITKDPSAVLDYKFDWASLTNSGRYSDWLDTAASEIISSYTVTVPVGITKDSDDRTDANTSVTVWLSGGTEGEAYNIVCQIVTSTGRKDERTIRIPVMQR